MRQYRREYLERMRDAETLRDGLREEGRDSQDLEEAIEALRRLQDENVYRDLPQIALLQEELRESLRRVEFTLRREVEGEREDRVFLSGSDEVPTGFRKLVEEYYRSLARDPSGDG